MIDPSYRIAVVKGDGIGVDVTDASLTVMDAAQKRVGGFSLEFQEILGGAGLYKETGRDMAPGAEEAAEEADAIFLGAIGP